MYKEWHYAILANTAEIAESYAAKKLPPTWRKNTLIITERADLYCLYGCVGVAFDVVPGTNVLPWHTEVREHMAYGRLAPMRHLITS